MRKKNEVFKILFSIVFIGLAILKISFDWFNTRIDITIIGLVLLAFLPWLSEYLKSIEAFGIKAEFPSDLEKEKIDKEANKVIEDNKELINESKSIEITKNINKISEIKMIDTINSIDDPVEKMVLIRYETEKGLRDICNKAFNEKVYFKNIRSMADELYEDNIIASEVKNLIYDLMPILNKAVHADTSIKDYNDIKWIIDKGMLILDYLNMVQNNLKNNKK